jgi:2,4'-dihydroxyacetophenone dioxygenase
LIVPHTILTDERIWVPVEENVWFRRLLLAASRGYWMNVLRVRKSGVLSRYRHPQPDHGYAIKGGWRDLEHA